MIWQTLYFMHSCHAWIDTENECCPKRYITSNLIICTWCRASRQYFDIFWSISFVLTCTFFFVLYWIINCFWMFYSSERFGWITEPFFKCRCWLNFILLTAERLSESAPNPPATTDQYRQNTNGTLQNIIGKSFGEAHTADNHLNWRNIFKVSGTKN